MRLSQLRFLVELENNGTISKTAQKLFISQPSLSTAIKELEEELGFDIIERSNRGVSFTKQGAIVLKYSREIMQLIHKIEQMRTGQELVQRGYLAIASVSYIFPTVVMDAFLEVKNQYHDIVATLREENSYDIVELLANKEIDLGIIMISNLEELKFRQVFEKYHLQFHKLFDDRMHFIVGKKNPLFGQEEATMQELLQFPFVTRRNILNQFNKDMLLQYNKAIEFIQIDDSESFLKYIIHSQAICAMPKCSFGKSGYTIGSDLHALQIKDFVWTQKLGWIYPKEERYFMELKTFVALLEEKCQNISSSPPL